MQAVRGRWSQQCPETFDILQPHSVSVAQAQGVLLQGFPSRTARSAGRDQDGSNKNLCVVSEAHGLANLHQALSAEGCVAQAFPRP